METILLNNELRLSFPAGFHRMDEAERGALHFAEAGPGECFNDPERHIIISVSWKRSAFSALMLGSGEVATRMEARVRQLMEPFGYARRDFVSRTLDGREAAGFRYGYAAQGIDMLGESWSVKHRKTFYYIHFYFRKALETETGPVLDGILDSARWT